MAPLRDTVKLPKIVLSNPNLTPGTPTWDLVRHDVFKALQNFGCFECIHENLIPLELYTNLLGKDGLFEELFNLPKETKQRFVDPRKPFDGYIGVRPCAPLLEMVGIGEALDSPANIKNLTNLLWPEGNSRFSDSLLNYGKKLQELTKTVKMMVFEELGVEKYFESHNESTVYSIRMNKYAAPDTDEDQVGGGAHNDKHFMAILQQNHVHGLEVQTKDGVWFKVSPSSPSSFIILVGESFLAWSNGRIHSARHRVILSRRETRYSVALFSSLKGTIQCPEELVDEEHPLLFKPFDEIGILRFYITKEGRGAESTLKTYCGV